MDTYTNADTCLRDLIDEDPERAIELMRRLLSSTKKGGETAQDSVLATAAKAAVPILVGAALKALYDYASKNVDWEALAEKINAAIKTYSEASSEETGRIDASNLQDAIELIIGAAQDDE